MKYLKELIENNSSLDSIKEKLHRQNNKTIIDTTILGVPSIIVKSKINEETIESVYNDYDFFIISNTLDIITTSLPKMINSNSLYASTDHNLKYNIKNMIIEDWINGEYVIVANYNNDMIISTKSNLYATNIIPGTTESYYSCLVDKFESYSPYGLDFLSSPKIKNYIWIFNITNNKDVYLLTAYDRISLQEIPKQDLKTFISKFNIKMPKYEYIGHTANILEIKNKFKSNYSKGIIYYNIKTGYRETENVIKFNNNINQFMYSYSKNILYKITDLIMEDKISTAKCAFNKYNDLIDLLDLKFKKQYKKVEQAFYTAKKLKTQKQIANSLKEFNYSSFIFDSVYLDKIDFKYFGEYYKSKNLLKLNYNNSEIEDLVNKYIIPTLKEK